MFKHYFKVTSRQSEEPVYIKGSCWTIFMSITICRPFFCCLSQMGKTKKHVRVKRLLTKAQNMMEK